MSVSVFLASAMLSVALADCPGPACRDPSGDQLPGMFPPALDVVEIDVQFKTDVVIFEITFDPATATPADLEWLGGYLDIDVDSSPDTGRISIIDSYGLDPPCLMGVEYSLSFYPLTHLVELSELIGDLEMVIGTYESEIDGMTVRVAVPRCGPAPCAGLALGSSLQFCALLGNGFEWTDRVPNEGAPCTASVLPGDLDEDGDIDPEDLRVFTECVSGPNVYVFDPDCRATCDFDGDNDVDQTDFGVFQVWMTGSCSESI